MDGEAPYHHPGSQGVPQAPAQSSVPTTVAQEPQPVEAHGPDIPTASHGLAEQAATEKPLEERGYAELDHGEPEIKDAGWNEAPENVPKPLVGGLSNEDVWLLIRRFNKQIFHVKCLEERPISDLDFYIADDEEFSPDKLRAHLERLYMTIIVSLFSLWKHIVRLRSWRERPRTLAFLGIYSLAWLLDFIVPTMITFLIVLIMFPSSRRYCFPPVPPSAISSTGGFKKPSSGVLASDDSVTGAPQHHHGEAAEQEAHNFVASISSLIVSAAAGKDPSADPHEDSAAPDPAAATAKLTEVKSKAAGDEPGAQRDRTKEAVSVSVWEKARPVMRGLSDVVDTYERFGNAMSPTLPFPNHAPRLAICGVLSPMLLMSLFTTSYMMAKGMGLAFGFVFFADPILQKGIAFINRTYPRWKKYLELQNTILKGVPTNAQLTITLLRIGERNKAPLPPPPGTNAPPPIEAHEGAEQQLSDIEGADDGEIIHATKPDHRALGTNLDNSEPNQKPNKVHRVMNFLKGTTKGGINTSVAADKVKAKAGAKQAKDRLGVIKRQPDPATGPVRFPARWRGKKGHAYITTTATTPALSWTSDPADLNPAWTVAVGDIYELRKVGGLGWKSKILVGWATEREIADGLVITDKQGNEAHLTAIITRDELFNRLVAMGEQMWEAW